MTRIRILLSVIFILFSFQLFSQDSDKETPQAKYVFLFIGDGMGQAQVNLAEAYLSALKGEAGLTHLSFTRLPQTGFVSTYANDRFITCSAAAATAIATGSKTNIGRIGMDTSGTVRLESIAEKARKKGMKVGIITSVSLDHATPAAFYAHQPDREMYFEIGWELLASDFNYFAGGGLIQPTGIYRDKQVNLLEEAKLRGYSVISTFAELKGLRTEGKTIYFCDSPASEASLPFALDRPVQQPSLADLTEKGINLLNNPKGFFIMVEGGKIDWAGHSNDAGTVVNEVIAFDQAVAKALEFYERHPEETLIVVTADHETGGLALGNQANGYDSRIDILKYQKISYEALHNVVMMFREKKSDNINSDFDRVMKRVEKDYGLDSKENKTLLSPEEKGKLMEALRMTYYNEGGAESEYSRLDPFTVEIIRLMSEKAGVGWTTTAHTGVNVPIFAIGPGAKKFSGYIDNTDIARILERLIGISGGKQREQ